MRKITASFEKQFKSFSVLPGIDLAWYKNKWKTINLTVVFIWLFWEIHVRFSEKPCAKSVE